MNHHIYAIVTAYYPNEQAVRNISKLEEQVSSVFIIDNTPKKDNSALFRHLSKTVYIPNKENLGLSAAFNICLKLDALKKSDYILFMDQDSLIPDNLAAALVLSYQELHDKGYAIGCIGPIYYEKNAMKLMVSKRKKALVSTIYSVPSIITSGMLTTYTNLESIGFWNERIFLDWADFDLCWRFNRSQLLCCITQNVVLDHRLGESVKHIGTFLVKEDAPIREYYQTRDGLKLMLQSYTPVRLKIYFLLILFFRPLVHIIFLSHKRMRMKYIFIGIVDAIRGKCGAY